MASSKRGRRNFARVLLIVLLAGAGYLGKKGFVELTERKADERFYAQLAQRESGIAMTSSAIEATTEPETAIQAATETEARTAIQATTADGDALTDGRSSEMDFDALREICPDVVGWLRIEDTKMDYPIVRGEDNVYYLSHLADGTRGSSGAIMMDCTNTGDFCDTVSILHGHNMRSGAMFGNLDDYRDEAFYRQHPTIRLFTPAGDYDVEVFAAYTVNGYAFGYPTSFADEAAFDLFVRKAVSSCGYETGVEVAYGDRLLLLSTCAYSFEGARFVVIGKINMN